MAQLNPSNIQNGNIIQANDVLQLYDALTSGGGYNVSISGSLTGSASTAITATTATTATTADTTLSSNVNYIDTLQVRRSTNFRSIAGISNDLESGTVVVNISDISSSSTQLGVDIFVTASPSGSLSSPIQVDYSGSNLIFTTQDTGSTARVLFTGWIV
jgi:hypothetical protein